MFRRFMRLSVQAIIILALLFTLGCKSRKKKPEVGVILALSGSADFIGKPERDVLEAMMKHLSKDCLFELTILDSESKSDRARALFDSFIFFV